MFPIQPIMNHISYCLVYNYSNVYMIESITDLKKMINSTIRDFSSDFFMPEAKKNFNKFFNRTNAF